VHASLDAQERALIGADPDRRVERVARLPVDFAFVAARVGQALLERLELVSAHLRRIDVCGAGGRENGARLEAKSREKRHPTPPEFSSYNQLRPPRRADDETMTS
jgi:hypothetical protein